MSSTKEDMDQVQDKLKDLEIGQATQAATLVGAQATQAAAHAGTWSTIVAGATSLVVGMFLGMAVAKARR